MKRPHVLLTSFLIAALAFGGATGEAKAQGGGGAGGGGAGGGGAGGGGAGGSTNGGGGSGVAGIAIDAKGVLTKQIVFDPGGRLTRDRMANAKANLNREVAKVSPLRKVSLGRLEAAIQGRLDRNRDLPEDIRYLAGLTRIRYVFFYPDSGDIVIAGPAEGWFEDLAGNRIGMNSGHPVLELQDLIVALRAYGPGKSETPMIGCSIDPTQEGLARMQEFLRQIRGPLDPTDATVADRIVEGLHESLGMQKVRVMGVSPKTHFAQVLVEADYRMKLIGIGLERPPVKGFKSFVDLANAAQMSRNAMQRWWFVPDYNCARISDDHLAIELVGEGVNLVGEDEVVGAGGQRVGSGKAGRSTKAYTNGFTSKYPEIARTTPIYARLRSLIDMAIAAAHIQREDYYAKAGWNMEVLGDEELLPVETLTAPVEVDTVVTSLIKNNRLVTPIGGGVRVEAQMALESSNLLPDEGAAVEKTRQDTNLDGLKPGQWWWD
jgi:hypothetical protein